MNAIRDVWDNLEVGLRRHGLDDRDIIRRTAQTEYYRLCEYTDWQLLRRTVDVASSAAGTLLPADLIGIIHVIDSDGNEVAPTEQQTREFRGYNKKSWHFRQDAVVPLYEGKSLTMEQGASAISVTPALDSSYIGEYVSLGAEPGFYKLATVSTLETPYYGPRLNADVITVRPRSCKRLCVTEDDGDASSETVTVHYWAYPPPLYQPWQQVLLPSTRILELKVIIAIVGFHEKQERAADNYRAEYADALAQALKLNPKFIAPAPPQAAAGCALKFGRR